MKTTSLSSGPLLDLYVAKGLKRIGKIDPDKKVFLMRTPEHWVRSPQKYIGYSPSSRWIHGGPIIENERINIKFECETTEPEEKDRVRIFQAGYGEFDESNETIAYGHSALEAAMICFVQKHIGPEIEEISTLEEEIIQAPSSAAEAEIEEARRIQQIYGGD
jgi:hypothetical protein